MDGSARWCRVSWHIIAAFRLPAHNMMSTKTLARAGLLSGLLAVTVAGEPLLSAAQRANNRFATVKQWNAEVIVTSDCDGVAIDGSRTVIHNRIVTTYELTRRVSKAPGLTWSGRASTTYRWAVGTEFRGSRDMEESSGTFDVNGELELTTSLKLSMGRPPGRPFTRKSDAGEPARLRDSGRHAPGASFRALPSDEATSNGERAESAYRALGGGIELPRPAPRSPRAVTAVTPRAVVRTKLFAAPRSRPPHPASAFLTPGWPDNPTGALRASKDRPQVGFRSRVS